MEQQKSALPEGWDEAAWMQSFAERRDFRSGALLVCAALRREDWPSVLVLTEYLIAQYRSPLAPFLLWLHSTALRRLGQEEEAAGELRALDERLRQLTSPRLAVWYAPLRAAVLRETGREEGALALDGAFCRVSESGRLEPQAAEALRTTFEALCAAYQTPAPD